LVRYNCNKAKEGGNFMEKVYYKVIETTKNEEKDYSIRLYNPKPENKFCREFETIKEAKKGIEKAISDRKRQMFYFRNDNGEIVDKISYYDRYEVSYEVIKVVEEIEKVFECDNKENKRKEANKDLQEEIWI
jgi:hypothetical protein